MHLDLATILILHPLSLVVGAICFLYLRWHSRCSHGLGTMAVALLLLAAGSLLAGAGANGQVDYAIWTFVSFILGPVSYAFFWIGLLSLVHERGAGRGWWVLVLPVILSVAALATGFHLDNLSRATVFLSVMGGFALASAWLVASDPKIEGLKSRYGLAGVLVLKAVIAFVTIASIALPQTVAVTPPETFLVLILCQFAIAMFVLILVQERSEKRLIALTETDSLTGIRNRHWLMDRMPRQAGMGSAFVIFDIDHFKHVNDRCGHQAGDQVLTAVAQKMARLLGAQALLARMGGEEFGLFLPQATAETAMAKAELLRQAVEALIVEHDGVRIPVTLSAGAAVAPVALSMTRLVACADEALYCAKRAGRNRVRLFAFETATDEATAASDEAHTQEKYA